MTRPPMTETVGVKLTKAREVESCATCRFGFPAAEGWGSEVLRQCRRRPPIMVKKRSSCATWMGPGWPEINATEWCGEYEPAGRSALQAGEE